LTDRKYKVEIFYRTKNAVSQDQESKGALSIWSTMTSYDTAPISLIPTTLLESRSTPHTCRSSEQPSLDPKIGRALASSSSKILPRCGFVRIRLASLAMLDFASAFNLHTGFSPYTHGYAQRPRSCTSNSEAIARCNLGAVSEASQWSPRVWHSSLIAKAILVLGSECTSPPCKHRI